jgi:hypothetical protein
MPVTRLEFVAQTARDPAHVQGTTERLINLYAEPQGPEAAGRWSLKAVPGLRAWASLPGVFIRALGTVDRRLFGVIDGRLHEIDAGGSVTDLGAVTDSPRTFLAGNLGALTIAAGGDYFVFDGSGLQQPTLNTITRVGSVEYLAGRTIITQEDGRLLQWSDIGDPAVLDPLNVASAERSDDNIRRVVASSGNLFIFKEQTTEVWAPTGLGGADAFSPIPGLLLERGLLDATLAAKIPDGVFFVGDDGVAYIALGTQFQPVSNPPVNESIRATRPSHVAYYEHAGHRFCVVRFPTQSGRPALVFDLATQLWHERATASGAWEVTHTARAFGAWRAGVTGGAVAELAGGVFADLGAPLRRVAVSRTLRMPRGLVVSEIVLSGRIGQADIGREPLAMVRASRDGGQTWGAERTVGMGPLGQYDRRARLGSWGTERVMAFEVAITDPAELTLDSAAEVMTG